MSNLDRYKDVLRLKSVEHSNRVDARQELIGLNAKLKSLQATDAAAKKQGASKIELSSIKNLIGTTVAKIQNIETSMNNMNKFIGYLNQEISRTKGTGKAFEDALKYVRDNGNNARYSDGDKFILDNGVRAVVSDIPYNWESEPLPLLDSALANPYGSPEAFQAKLWTMRGKSIEQVKSEMEHVKKMIADDINRLNAQATDTDKPDEFRGLDYKGDIMGAAAALYSSLRGETSPWSNGVYHVLRTEIAQVSKGGRTDNLNVKQIDIIIRLSNWLRPVASQYTMNIGGDIKSNNSKRWCWFAPYEGYSAAKEYYDSVTAKGKALKAESRKIKNAAKELIDSGGVLLIDSKGEPQN